MTEPQDRLDAAARAHFSILYAAVLLISLIFCGYGSWAGYFYDVDTPRYASASLEMAQTGDYLRPMDNGVPRLAKPPLPYWVTAPLMQAVLAVGGPLSVTPFVARIPAVLAAVAAIAAVVLIGRRIFGDLAGLLSGLALGASIVFHLEGYLPRVDIYFAASLAWASYFFLLRLQGDRRRRVVVGAALFTMLGVLSRGPFAFYAFGGYLMAVAADGYLLRACGAPDGQSRWKALLSIRPLLDTLRDEWKMIAVCSVVGCGPFLLWMYLCQAVGGVNFWAGFEDQVAINTTAETTTFWRKFWETGFYADTIIFVFFPWGSFLLGAVWDLGRDFNRRRREILFFVMYVAVVVLSATLIHKLKSHRYVIAALPWLAVWVAGWLTAAPEIRRKRQLLEVCTWWALAVIAFFLYHWIKKDVVPIAIYFSVPAPDGLLRWALIGAVAVFAGLCAWTGFRRMRSPGVRVLLLVLGFALALPLYHAALPSGDPPRAYDEPLLGPAVAGELLSSFDNRTLIVNSYKFVDLYPDVQFYQKHLSPDGVYYSLNVHRNTAVMVRLLAAPNLAANAMASERYNYAVLPAYHFFKSRTFERTVLLLCADEVPGVQDAARRLGVVDLEIKKIEGRKLTFRKDAVYMAALRQAWR
ncbi:MAG: hypothetical protein PWQ57_1591 [Desulfovibrionales bacterium]|nr:hypothetical protein [Desulfovibrionales bacterium]